MRVECISTSIGEEQRRRIGMARHLSPNYELCMNDEYDVIGIELLVNHTGYGSSAVYLIDDGSIGGTRVPSCLFSIVDDRYSKYWVVNTLDGFDISIYPKEFLVPGFFEDVGDRTPDSVAIFDRVRNRLRTEFL